MGEDDTHHGGPSRRTVLQIASLAGGLGLVPSSVTAGGRSSQSSSSQRDDSSALGDFETGLDAWTTTGRNSLHRVTSDEFPAGVTSGKHGLVVEVQGDAYPMISNRRRVRDADFATHPYLQADVFAATKQTTADIVLTFRLHHAAGRSAGGSKDSTSRGKDKLVEESEPTAVPQLGTQRVQWDMSSLSDEKLRTAKRLELTWYHEGHKPDGGHRGQTSGGFEYEGLVVFDNIRLSASPPVTAAMQLTQRKRQLHREHGMIIERVIEYRSPKSGRGRIVFADGYEASYEYEQFASGGYRYTIDGVTFEVGGGNNE